MRELFVVGGSKERMTSSKVEVVRLTFEELSKMSEKYDNDTGKICVISFWNLWWSYSNGGHCDKHEKKFASIVLNLHFCFVVAPSFENARKRLTVAFDVWSCRQLYFGGKIKKRVKIKDRTIINWGEHFLRQRMWQMLKVWPLLTLSTVVFWQWIWISFAGNNSGRNAHPSNKKDHGRRDWKDRRHQKEGPGHVRDSAGADQEQDHSKAKEMPPRPKRQDRPLYQPKKGDKNIASPEVKRQNSDRKGAASPELTSAKNKPQPGSSGHHSQDSIPQVQTTDWKKKKKKNHGA